MANIVLKTFAAGDEGQGTVTPQDDSLIYQNAVSVNGIFGGATVTLTGANTLHVASGLGIICGRFFEINESDISVQLSSSGTLSGRLKIHLDLNNADNPIEIVTETGATLPALSGDSNININGGAFDMELCTFSVNELTISSLVNTFPTIDNTSKQIRRKTAYAVNDFVLCQSASDALIFICTTAGATAVQEPTAYATVTDGNTVTDGTAVFKAVSVAGQITQISKIGNLSSLNTTDKSSAVAAINEVNTKISKTEVLIAPVLTSLVAPSGGLASGDQFIYQGLLYKATAAIASGGTIIIDGNCKLADNVTNQILLLTSELNKLKNATRRTQRNITTDLANLPTAVAEQNLEKYGYSIGDYFIGNSGYTYFLADPNTFRGAQSNYAVINQNHISIVVKTGANSKWNNTNNTSTGYVGSVLHSYMTGTVLENIKSDFKALFGGSTGLEHLLSHQKLYTKAVSDWAWVTGQYISALTEAQVYGTTVWSINSYQTGEAWKQLELFKKFSYMEILGWIWFWLRSIRSASNACDATNGGTASDYDASGSVGVVGLIIFK